MSTLYLLCWFNVTVFLKTKQLLQFFKTKYNGTILVDTRVIETFNFGDINFSWIEIFFVI